LDIERGTLLRDIIMMFVIVTI